jgi:hypothetical protein
LKGTVQLIKLNISESGMVGARHKHKFGKSPLSSWPKRFAERIKPRRAIRVKNAIERIDAFSIYKGGTAGIKPSRPFLG